jgi:hypothetical protein
MVNQPAVGRRPLSLGWVLQILLWSLGATALFLSRAIDIGVERYPVHFTYTTPLYLRDVLGMIALARPIDFLVRNMANAVLWSCILSPLVLILDRSRRIRPLWRLIILGAHIYLVGFLTFFGLRFFLYYLPQSFFYGFLSLFVDLPRLLTHRLDGEWLGEGWNAFEASALWMITIVILLLQLLPPWTWRWIWPSGDDVQGEPAGPAEETA